MNSALCDQLRKSEMEEKPRKTYYGVSLIGASEVKKLFEELEQMPAKSFDTYLIAYIDFLGMKDKMKKARRCRA